jgi:hypothetical protein
VAGERAVNWTAWCIAIRHVSSRRSIEASEGELGEEAAGEGAERANGGDFERHIDYWVSSSNSGIQMVDKESVDRRSD